MVGKLRARICRSAWSRLTIRARAGFPGAITGNRVICNTNLRRDFVGRQRRVFTGARVRVNIDRMRWSSKIPRADLCPDCIKDEHPTLTHNKLGCTRPSAPAPADWICRCERGAA